ncbi:MAG: c-type cytochrome [Chloroflexota bacterium]|nr:c-type cytochrome [Chloroflexota bacterium]
MRAVQRLALIVVIGLTALATLLVVYLADEDNRRAAEAEEQTEASLERAMATYNQFCVSCHGPGGRGSLETGRIGYPLAGDYVGPDDAGYDERNPMSASARNQNEDPVQWTRREATITAALHEGRGAMPLWGEEYGGELNDVQIEELVLLIHEGDWNEVYNHVVEESGGYPTVQVEGSGNDATADDAAGGVDVALVELSAPGIAWSDNDLVVVQGGTVRLINDGSGGAHNFIVEGYNDDAPVDMPVGSEVDWVVPADLAPGTYVFYCGIPGHRATMEGQITIQPPGEVSAPEGANPPAGTPTVDTPTDSQPVPASPAAAGGRQPLPAPPTVPEGASRDEQLTA